MVNLERTRLCWGAALFVSACAAVGDPDASMLSREVDLGNGTTVNGTTVNGTTVNGTTVNGTTLAGTTFVGVLPSGKVISGTDFLGARMTGTLTDGTTVTLRLDSITQGSWPNQDVTYYGVSSQGPGGWQSICVDWAGNRVPAIPVSGYWNYQQGVAGGGSKTSSTTIFTWGCRGSAIAKCVELGYKPWRLVDDDLSLEPFHEACVRAIRADFCGDGTPYTVNGNLIDIYDGYGVQSDTESWPFEAEWTRDGARCLTDNTRWRAPVPCYPERSSPSCGSYGDFFSGTLLMTEATPP